jgi:uncharacterized coiled-coil protein SlyX
VSFVNKPHLTSQPQRIQTRIIELEGAVPDLDQVLEELKKDVYDEKEIVAVSRIK